MQPARDGEALNPHLMDCDASHPLIEWALRPRSSFVQAGDNKDETGN